MRIAVVNMTGGGLSDGGVKTMLCLVPCIRNDSRVKDLKVFVPPSIARHSAMASEKMTKWPAYDRWLGWPGLKKLLNEFSPDVIFIPAAAWFKLGKVPSVIMIRNTEPLASPTRIGRPLPILRNLLLRRVMKKSCYNATRIIAVSDFVAEMLTSKWSIETEKIGIVYHGVDSVTTCTGKCPPSLSDEEKGSPFIFTGGSFIWYRGLEDAIKAISQLKRNGLPHRLFICGRPLQSSGSYFRMLRKVISDSQISDRVIFLGQLSPEEMAWCFQNCHAFVMTSRLEACPNLALEAISYGCCIVSTRNPPMPEIFSDAALYYKAEDVNDLVCCLKNLNNSAPDRIKELKAAAKRRAAAFTWEAAARNTVNNLAQAIDSTCGKVRQS